MILPVTQYIKINIQNFPFENYSDILESNALKCWDAIWNFYTSLHKSVGLYDFINFRKGLFRFLYSLIIIIYCKLQYILPKI